MDAICGTPNVLPKSLLSFGVFGVLFPRRLSLPSKSLVNDCPEAINDCPGAIKEIPGENKPSSHKAGKGFVFEELFKSSVPEIPLEPPLEPPRDVLEGDNSLKSLPI